ncbi:glycerol kinase [Sinorhizobium fredii]
MGGYILAIDQGTTSTRAIVFDGKQQVAGVGQREFRQHFPKSGWVEHDPEEIWETVLFTARQAIEKAGISTSEIAAIGITNQRNARRWWCGIARRANRSTTRSSGRTAAPLPSAIS